jgi:predicted O-methyltransferase YrrM
MLRNLFLIFSYLNYLIFSKSRHGTHSPFVYSFIDKILYDKEQYIAYHHIELIRESLMKSNTVISIEDYGASGKSTKKDKIKSLASASSKSPKYGRLLYRICKTTQPRIGLELGTNFGISTMYNAAAMNNGVLHSIEGSIKLCEIAQYHYEKTGLTDKVVQHQGNFDEVLPYLLKELPYIDYAFIDGNHKKDATIQYFEQLLTKCHDSSILVFDDIRWSRGMEEAWEIIKNHPAVTVSIDLFVMGIVFFRKEQSKENFVIRF